MNSGWFLWPALCCLLLAGSGYGEGPEWLDLSAYETKVSRTDATTPPSSFATDENMSQVGDFCAQARRGDNGFLWFEIDLEHKYEIYHVRMLPRNDCYQTTNRYHILYCLLELSFWGTFVSNVDAADHSQTVSAHNETEHLNGQMLCHYKHDIVEDTSTYTGYDCDGPIAGRYVLVYTNPLLADWGIDTLTLCDIQVYGERLTGRVQTADIQYLPTWYNISNVIEHYMEEHDMDMSGMQTPE